MQGIDAMFKTDDLVADKIILTNGVEVIEANTKEFVIAANSTVTINGVKVKTDKETTIEANGTTLKVKLEEGTVNNNNLTFTSKEKKAVIGFVAITNGNPATYIGTITIDSDGGSVEVNTVSSVNVKDTKLNITAKNAKVDISGADQANNSSITTTLTDEFVQGNADKTLTFVAKKDIPAQITTAIANGSVDLKDYTDTELKSVFGNTLTAKQMEEIREFIDSFNLNGKGANIKAINGKVVTIDFTKAGTFTVEGIK